MSRTAARAVVDDTSNDGAGAGSDADTFEAGTLDATSELRETHSGNVPAVLGVDVLVFEDSVACDLWVGVGWRRKKGRRC